MFGLKLTTKVVKRVRVKQQLNLLARSKNEIKISSELLNVCFSIDWQLLTLNIIFSHLIFLSKATIRLDSKYVHVFNCVVFGVSCIYLFDDYSPIQRGVFRRIVSNSITICRGYTAGFIISEWRLGHKSKSSGVDGGIEQGCLVQQSL